MLLIFIFFSSSKYILCFFFFFSSRRRHTRWNCDWSSDVCSSDLTHAERVGECQRLAVVAGSVLGTARRRDITGEAEGVGLASPSPQPTGECQRLSGVAGGLVDPPGREAGHSRAQKNECRPHVPRAIAKILDGPRDQRERLVATACEVVGDAKGRGDERCTDDDPPRSAEVEASLKDPRRAWESPATEVEAAEIGRASCR